MSPEAEEALEQLLLQPTETIERFMSQYKVDLDDLKEALHDWVDNLKP